MVKKARKSTPKSGRSLNMEEEDSDEVYDEIDRFHMERNDLGDLDFSRPRRKVEEVLNVEGDISDDEEEEIVGDEDDSSFDSADDDHHDGLPSADKWGKTRKSYYSTSYVDADWGGMNEREEEVAVLEEEDAIARQKKLDAALAAIEYDAPEAEVEVAADILKPSKDIESMTNEEKLKFFLTSNPDFETMISEYSAKRKILISFISPLMKISETLKGERKTILGQQISTAFCVFSSYLLNILFYLHLKNTSKLVNEESKKYLDDHPVLDAIISQKKKIMKVESFLEANTVTLNAILERRKEKSFIANLFHRSGYVDEVSKVTGQPELAVSTEKMDETSGQEGDGVYEDADDGSKRGITLQMEKNRGLATKHKKGTQHSRVKKRKQYKKALIRKRSQRPDVRRELRPYGGETRGIRISTVKSIKFKA